MDIKVIGDTGEVINNKPDERVPEQLVPPVLPQLMEDAIAQVMDIDSSERHKYADKLGTLMEYVKSQTKDLTPENIKWVIRSLELKLGTPPFAEKRINYVAQYAYLLSEKKKLDKDIRNFEIA
jgi:hypothetical protein